MFVQAVWVNNAMLVGLGYLSFSLLEFLADGYKGHFLFFFFTLNESISKCV